MTPYVTLRGLGLGEDKYRKQIAEKISQRIKKQKTGKTTRRKEISQKLAKGNSCKAFNFSDQKRFDQRPFIELNRFQSLTSWLVPFLFHSPLFTEKVHLLLTQNEKFYPFPHTSKMHRRHKNMTNVSQRRLFTRRHVHMRRLASFIWSGISAQFLASFRILRFKTLSAPPNLQGESTRNEVLMYATLNNTKIVNFALRRWKKGTRLGKSHPLPPTSHPKSWGIRQVRQY